MEERDHIWNLAAKKLSGEATAEELEELQQLLQQHPEMVASIGVLSAIWKPSDQKIDEAETENAFNRHMHRMEKLEEAKEEEEELNHRAVLWNNHRRKRLFITPFANGMLSNYAKIAWRNVTRNKAFSFINITGLALGIACAVLILLWIQNELNMEQFHSKKDRIYQVINRVRIENKMQVWWSTPMVAGPVMKETLPEIEAYARANWVGAFTFSSGDKHLETQGYITDPSFLTIFDFPLVAGDAKTALSSPRGLVITEKLAHKLFGDATALGREIKVDSTALFTVTGVMKDFPPNTTFNFEYLVPWSYTKEVGWENPDWQNNSIATILLLKPGVSEAAFGNKIEKFLKSYAPEAKNQFFLHPLSKWWLYSRFENGVSVGGRIEYVRLFSIIAAFILLIACINYMNLGTARSVKRAKEVGIRKVVGANKGILVRQFIGESILFAFISGLIALAIVQPVLPWFNELTGKQLSIPWSNEYFWLFAIGFILFTGILAGSYPAFYLSAFQPIRVLKGTFKATHALITPRKVLVVIQFTFAITLTICTIVIYRQIDFARKRDTGYSKDNLVYVYMKGDLVKKYALVKDELLRSNAVLNVTRTSSPITELWSMGDGYKWKGRDPNIKLVFGQINIDNDFTRTMGLKLIAGRDINTNLYPADSTALLVNEAAVKQLGFKDPVGEVLEDGDGSTKWTIRGVVKDYMPTSPFDKIMPVIMQGPKAWSGTMTFKLNPAYTTADNLETIGNIIKKYNPDYPFDYNFVDKVFAEKFGREQQTGTLAALFAGLTIFISCLGLFALAAYMAENRVKEIGVRKVLGASVSAITTLLSKDFLLLVLIAFAIASPIAWWCMNSWLRSYPYRINISWWMFAVTGICSTIIAILTVSYQAIKAALANPIAALRNE
ncbi:MAG: ABC transporter permease [Chitinophagaceae bacterium]